MFDLNNGLLDLGVISESTEPTTGGKDQHQMPTAVPGGLSEKPAGQPADTGVPIPSKTELTDAEYKAAIAALQKSYKECSDVLAILGNSTIVEKDAVDLAMESAEFNDAFLNLFESGPIFEAVDRSDKDAVKKIVNKIRKSVKSKLDQEDVSYYEPNLVARLIAGVLSGAAVGAANGLVNPMSTAKISLGIGLGAAISPGAAVAGAVAGGSLKAITKFWSVRLWQVIGVCHVEEGNINDITKMLTEEFKDDLGEYKVLAVKVNRTLLDVFRTKFKWKNTKNAYFLLVDKKIPAEIKEMQKEIDSAIKDGKSAPIKEGAECNEGEFEEGAKGKCGKKDCDSKEKKDDKSIYHEYVRQFIESGRPGRPLTIDEFVEAYIKHMSDDEEYDESTALSRDIHKTNMELQKIDNQISKLEDYIEKNNLTGLNRKTVENQINNLNNRRDSLIRKYSIPNSAYLSYFDSIGNAGIVRSKGMNSKDNQRKKFNTTQATPKKSVAEIKANINKILKESTDEDVNDVKELYKEYVVDFIESGVEGSPLSFDEFTEEVTTDEHIDAETHLKKFLENI